VNHGAIIADTAPIAALADGQCGLERDLEIEIERELEIEIERELEIEIERDLEIEIELGLERDLEIEIELGLEIDLEIEIELSLELGLEIGASESMTIATNLRVASSGGRKTRRAITSRRINGGQAGPVVTSSTMTIAIISSARSVSSWGDRRR
jgi:hypothetical protein